MLIARFFLPSHRGDNLALCLPRIVDHVSSLFIKIEAMLLLEKHRAVCTYTSIHHIQVSKPGGLYTSDPVRGYGNAVPDFVFVGTTG